MNTPNVNGELQECIKIAFGKNGPLAKAFIQVFNADFVLPFRKRLRDLTLEKLISR